jgi:hypothetical protein
LLRFLAHVRSDQTLQQRLNDALTADEVSLLAQELGFRVSGSDILRFGGQSASGIRITRIDHPGEYPGRYYSDLQGAAMSASDSSARCLDPAQQRQALLQLLRQEPRGSAQQRSQQVMALIEALEHSMPADLAAADALQQLECVWELRWSNSAQPYLAAGPWLENLQLLAPSQGRGMNLLRLPGAFDAIGGIAVEAAIAIDTSAAETSPAQRRQRVSVRFQRGGWLGPQLGGNRLGWLRSVQQSFPAWLDITVLDDELRVCRGNAGTVFALLRRRDLHLQDLLLAASSPVQPNS